MIHLLVLGHALHPSTLGPPETWRELGVDGGGDGGQGGAGGGQGGRPESVPMDRFQKVVQERNDLRSKIAELEGQVQANAEKLATTDTLAKRLKDVETEFASARGQWNEERSIFALGITDPDAIDVARVFHRKLPEENRPPLPDWLGGLVKDPSKAPTAMRGILPQQAGAGAGGGGGSGAAGADGAQNGGGGSKSANAGGAGGHSTTTNGQRTDGAQQAPEPLSPEQIRAIRDRAMKTNDWSEWKRVRGQVLTNPG